MTFLNYMLIGGISAALIPLAIYLWSRSRYRVVRWGAMHLLDSVLRVNKRRIQIEQLILLAIRVAIPTLLAICMARPVLTGMRHLIGKAKSSMVVLLDNSYSMEAGDSVRTTFAIAQEETDNVLSDLPYGSEAAVLGLAGPMPAGVEDPRSDIGKLRKALGSVEAGYGMAAVPRAVETASGVFASRMHSGDRVLLVVSDFQRVSWASEEAPARRRAFQMLRDQDVKPVVVFFPVGKEMTSNAAVESLVLSRQLLGVKQPVKVRANLHNYGDTAFPDLRVYFKVDGKERSVSQFSLGAGERGQVLFTHEFDKPGSHVLEASIDADMLRADNTLQVSVPVVDRIPVLLVCGDANPEPLRAETAFLEVALQPFNAAKASLADLITTKTIREEELQAAQLAEVRVAVLANVRQLTDDQRVALENFVRDGGGLLVFPGDRANAAWYNSKLVADGVGLLPFQLLSLAGSVKVEDQPASIVPRHYEHAALDLFNDPRNGSLAGAQIRLWYKLGKPAGVPAGTAESVVLANLDTGDPLFVERAFGEGRVIEACLPCDADWSNLPMRPFYLPMMQELVTYLAAKVYPPRNVEVGQPLAAFLPLADADKLAAVVDPAGKRNSVRVLARGSRGIAEFKATARPGLYVFEPPTGEPVHFVVTTSRQESDPARLSASEIQALAKECGAKVVTSWKDYRALDKTRRSGQELWPLLLWAVLGLLFAELALEQYFARKK